jgi:hypothetical protein
MKLTDELRSHADVVRGSDAADVMIKAADELDRIANRAAIELAWAVDVFGSTARSPVERTLRFVEEAIEVGYESLLPFSVLMKIVHRVYNFTESGTAVASREHIAKEIGQALMCLEALALSRGIDANAERDKEFERLIASDPEKRRARHAKKIALGIALPLEKD